MAIAYGIQYYLYLALGLVALGIEIWALADCVKRPAANFEATMKRTKGFWTAMTGGAAAVGALTVFVTSTGLFGLLQIVAVIAACVYLADVKPSVAEVRGGSGPYGPW
ncbi:DUF2516 family protein [Arthrobacter sp. H20]|uniref:DUF2516 family protein n=1 Tax=Arthrobacter sp. H20 TaxID=1267981 RepID=UPI00047981F9|nr:DUF2516 family protein [Arthrobacter sp. H20]